MVAEGGEMYCEMKIEERSVLLRCLGHVAVVECTTVRLLVLTLPLVVSVFSRSSSSSAAPESSGSSLSRRRRHQIFAGMRDGTPRLGTGG